MRPCCAQPLRLVATPALTPSSAQAHGSPACGPLTVTGGVTVDGGLAGAGPAGAVLAGTTKLCVAPLWDLGASGPQGIQAAPCSRRSPLGVAVGHLVPPTV